MFGSPGTIRKPTADSLWYRTIPVYESVLAVLLILTITEIILLVRHKLRPAAFLIINIIKALIWTAAFVLDIIVDSKNGYVGSIILDAFLL